MLVKGITFDNQQHLIGVIAKGTTTDIVTAAYVYCASFGEKRQVLWQLTVVGIEFNSSFG